MKRTKTLNPLRSRIITLSVKSFADRVRFHWGDWGPLSAQMVSYGDGVSTAEAVGAVSDGKLDYTTHDAIAIADGSDVYLGGEVLAPGAEVLMHAQIQERPHRDFLMHQQGFLSGKTEGDLDSVPGYYAGTASYKFVQNARHLNKLRVTRFKLHRDLGRHYDEYGRVVPDSFASLREESLASAKTVPAVPYSSVGPDMAFKEADQYGAYLSTMRPFASQRPLFDRMRTSPYGAYSPYGLRGMPYGSRGVPEEFGAYGRMDSMYRAPSTLAGRLNPRLSEGADLFNRVNRPLRSEDAFGSDRRPVDGL